MNFLSRLRSLDICDLSDAVDALELHPAHTQLSAVSAPRPIAGIAITVKLVAGNAPPAVTPKHLCTSAIEMGGPDHIIVVEQATGVDAAGWGGLLARAAQVRGIAGTIVEGPARDIEECNRVGYTVYARSTTCRTARNRVYEAECQTQVVLGDLCVAPGDYIAADASGCVVIPAARLEDVLSKAEDIRDRSDEMARAFYRHVRVSEVMGGNYENMLTKTPGAANFSGGNDPPDRKR